MQPIDEAVAQDLLSRVKASGPRSGWSGRSAASCCAAIWIAAA